MHIALSMFFHDYQMKGTGSQTTDSIYKSWISCSVRMWLNDSVVECLAWGWGVTGLRLTVDTVLCPLARHFILCSVLVQPTKRFDLTENFVEWDIKHQLKRTKHGPKLFKPTNVCRKYNAWLWMTIWSLIVFSKNIVCERHSNLNCK